jgi:hypothetical protein
MKSALFLILLSVITNAGIIRLSLVGREEAPGYSRHELGDGPEKKALFVKDMGFITEADIENAIPSPVEADAVLVTLSPEGTRKMVQATTDMRLGFDRIAILVDGKVLSAPVVQARLGKEFSISGLHDEGEAAMLAGRLMGKSGDEIKSAIAEDKERVRNLPKPPPPVYHTDEEYEELRKKREKVGLHYLDRVYTKEELSKLLKVGMRKKKIISKFGKPHQVRSNEDGSKTLTFETAPEKFSESTNSHLVSFTITIKSKKLISWKPHVTSNAPREPKPPASEPGNLLVKSPKIDMSAEDFDFITFIEDQKISLKPGKTNPTKSDYYKLMNLLWSISIASDETDLFNTQCDVFSILAKKLPELAALAKGSESGRIPASSLKEPLQPYITGGKQLP